MPCCNYWGNDWQENQALARENKNRIRPNEISNNNNNLIVQQRQQSDVMSHHAARQADRNKELESAGKRYHITTYLPYV